MKRVALLCLALAVALTARPISAQQLEIRFLDVGQGDAALIRSGTKTLLIDAGGSAGVVSYLRAFHIDTIDLVIASHNHASVGALIEYGEFHALFTGDSELHEFDYWLSNGAIPRVHVVKVAHHGSPNGTSAAWIEATHPQVAVISVGAGNSYGHPSAAV